MRAVLHNLVVCKGVEVCRHGQIIIGASFSTSAQMPFRFMSSERPAGAALSNTTPSYKTRKKHFPVLLRTTKLAQSTSQYCFALQSSQKTLPNTTSYYKALPSTTLHSKARKKALPNTTSYYKTRKKHFPKLLRTTRLAKSTSQYYFVLQSLHKVLPSTTSYNKACTKALPSTTSYYQ